MRTIQWLFVLSMLFFVSGISFVIAAARTTRSAAPVEAFGATRTATTKLRSAAGHRAA